MARLVGVDLPRDKRIEVALTYIYGIGRTRAQQVLAATGVSPDLRVHQLGDDGDHAAAALAHFFPAFFLPATVFFGPLRVRALVLVR